MNQLSFSRNHYEFFFFANSLSLSQICYDFTIFFCGFITILHSVPRLHFELTFFFANLLCMFFSFHVITMNLILVTRINCEYTIFLANNYKLTIFLANIHRMHYMWREFTKNSLSVSRIYYKFTFFSLINYEVTISDANLLWIHYFFREYTKNPISVSRIHYKFTIFFESMLQVRHGFSSPSTNSLVWSRVHFLFRKFNNKLSCSRIILLRIHCVLREFTVDILSFSRITMNSPSFSQIYYEFTNFLANILLINYLLRKFTVNSLSF